MPKGIVTWSVTWSNVDSISFIPITFRRKCARYSAKNFDFFLHLPMDNGLKANVFNLVQRLHWYLGCHSVLRICYDIFTLMFWVFLFLAGADGSTDSKVHGANMGPIWGRQEVGPMVAPMHFAISVIVLTALPSSSAMDVVSMIAYDAFVSGCDYIMMASPP